MSNGNWDRDRDKRIAVLEQNYEALKNDTEYIRATVDRMSEKLATLPCKAHFEKMVNAEKERMGIWRAVIVIVTVATTLITTAFAIMWNHIN